MVVILACVSMVAILGVLALSLDGGSLMAERRKAQAAADAAALAAACDLYDNYWTNNGAGDARHRQGQRPGSRQGQRLYQRRRRSPWSPSISRPSQAFTQASAATPR